MQVILFAAEAAQNEFMGYVDIATAIPFLEVKQKHHKQNVKSKKKSNRKRKRRDIVSGYIIYFVTVSVEREEVLKNGLALLYLTLLCSQLPITPMTR